MSMHRSLVSKSNLMRHRNVLSRAERIQKLADEGRWEEGDSAYGLPKVRVRRVTAGSKHKKKAEEAVEGEGEAEAEAENE
ncbi:small basic protein [bacterium]|nr:small basic protein [bacterium]